MVRMGALVCTVRVFPTGLSNAVQVRVALKSPTVFRLPSATRHIMGRKWPRLGVKDSYEYE